MTSLPKLLFADERGRIYDHPYLEMAGCSGAHLLRPEAAAMVELPAMSRMYFHPGCPPYGFDPQKKKFVLLRETKIGRRTVRCCAVSSFIRQGWVRLLLPAMDYRRKKATLPMWAYSAVGFADDSYWVPAFEIDANHRWHPDNFDDRDLLPHVEQRLQEFPDNRLIRHLRRCACDYHCFAAKNLFYRRWEAPVPTSPTCNAGCLGCISLQPGGPCASPQDRINFVPSVEEIVDPCYSHLTQAEDPIISFGQGCEGEPIMQWQRISEAVTALRRQTPAGTINLNTNGSVPAWVEAICDSGLDSIRISINSARPELYTRYYQPRGYSFDDVEASIAAAARRGVFTMLNYLIFPGISDDPQEVKALKGLVQRTKPHLIHFKNLNIDPALYLSAMGAPPGPGIGLDLLVEELAAEFPALKFGYFNPTREAFA